MTPEQHEAVYSLRSPILKAKNSISYEGEHYAGACPDSMKDEETLAQFKDRIVAELNAAKIPSTSSELDWITDGGYNG